jgi:hypothetical protein
MMVLNIKPVFLITYEVETPPPPLDHPVYPIHVPWYKRPFYRQLTEGSGYVIRMQSGRNLTLDEYHRLFEEMLQLREIRWASSWWARSAIVFKAPMSNVLKEEIESILDSFMTEEPFSDGSYVAFRNALRYGQAAVMPPDES